MFVWQFIIHHRDLHVSGKTNIYRCRYVLGKVGSCSVVFYVQYFLDHTRNEYIYSLNNKVCTIYHAGYVQLDSPVHPCRACPLLAIVRAQSVCFTEKNEANIYFLFSFVASAPDIGDKMRLGSVAMGGEPDTRNN